MRILCPNYDREDSLDTILEIPIQDDMFASNTGGGRLQTLAVWVKSQAANSNSGRNAELQLLLNVVGSPLIPCPVPVDQGITRSIRDCSIVRN